MPPFEITDAPRIVPIEDASKPDPRIAEWRRKAAIYDDLQEGEVGAHKHDALTRMATLGYQNAINAAMLLENMSRWYERFEVVKSKALKEAAAILRTEAGRGHDIVSDIEDGGNIYIMPGDV
jgi:Ni,Fe-hydrogenase III large subunit